MKRAINLIILFVVFLIGCAGHPVRDNDGRFKENKKSVVKITSSDDYEIYEAITHQVSDKQFVIEGTLVKWGERKEDLSPNTVTYLKKEIPEIDPSILKNISMKIEYELDTSRLSKDRWNFQRSSRIDSIFKYDKGWDKFYEIFPNAQGILNLSAIVYNSDRTKALVYAGNQTHWLSGSGFYYYLERKNGKWEIKKSAMAWIS